MKIYVRLGHDIAGGGTGSEVYYRNDPVSINLADKVSAKIAVTMGIRDRGEKYNNQLIETIVNTMPTIIVEPFFIDTQSDCDKFTALGGLALGDAIAQTINQNI